MFRLIRRSPWIALGAAAAYFLDGENGPERRRRAGERGRAWAERVREQWRAGPRPVALDTDEPLAPSVPDERRRSRADEPLGEEQAAGVPSPAPPAMAEQILAESERRVTDRAGTTEEHRRSEETVPGG
jgi:hypothetical protein